MSFLFGVFLGLVVIGIVGLILNEDGTVWVTFYGIALFVGIIGSVVIIGISKGSTVKELDQKHSIENCDKSDKCFKRIVFETCYSSERGYDCRIVKGSERAIGTELVE